MIELFSTLEYFLAVVLCPELQNSLVFVERSSQPSQKVPAVLDRVINDAISRYVRPPDVKLSKIHLCVILSHPWRSSSCQLLGTVISHEQKTMIAPMFIQSYFVPRLLCKS